MLVWHVYEQTSDSHERWIWRRQSIRSSMMAITTTQRMKTRTTTRTSSSNCGMYFVSIDTGMQLIRSVHTPGAQHQQESISTQMAP